MTFDGVAIDDPATGGMTERVFAVHGEITPSSPMAIQPTGARYYHSGRIQMLDPEQQVDVGFTGRVVDASKVASNPGVPV